MRTEQRVHLPLSDEQWGQRQTRHSSVHSCRRSKWPREAQWVRSFREACGSGICKCLPRFPLFHHTEKCSMKPYLSRCLRGSDLPWKVSPFTLIACISGGASWPPAPAFPRRSSSRTRRWLNPMKSDISEKYLLATLATDLSESQRHRLS